MTASEPLAKWGADSRVDDDVVCRVEEGRAAAARRRRRIIVIIEGLSLLQSIPPTTANKQTQAQKQRVII